MFMPYPQPNNPSNIPGLTGLVNQFNANYAFLITPNSPFHNAPNHRKVVIVDNLEMQLIHIINQASSSGVREDLIWLGAHRQEIKQALQQFNQLRNSYNLQRAAYANQHINGAYNNVGVAFSSARQTVGSAAVTAKSVAVGALFYGAPALAVGSTATGLSAFSFFGGPVVGAAVTIPVGVVSGVGVVSATVYGAIDGAMTDMETTLRRGVGFQN